VHIKSSLTLPARSNDLSQVGLILGDLLLQ